MYINFLFNFRFPLVPYCIIFHSKQVPKHSLNNNLVLFSRHRHLPAQYSHYMGNIRSSIYHYIHHTTYNTSIGNMCHVLYLFLCLRTLSSRHFNSHGDWDLNRFTPLHVEMLQNNINHYLL